MYKFVMRVARLFMNRLNNAYGVAFWRGDKYSYRYR